METIAVLIAAIFSCTGFWTLVQFLVQKHAEKDSKQGKMLKGLGHDRICCLAEGYLKQGYISREDYENLHDYLYLPYRDLGGDGTAQKLMNEVDRLPIRDTPHDKDQIAEEAKN